MFAPLLERPSIELAELGERAALMNRVDRKYVLPLPALSRLLQELPAGASVLEIDGRREMTYASEYFDTLDLALYRDAAHRHRRRFKVRTRTYCDSGESWLEIKTRGVRGRTRKERIRHHGDVERLGDEGSGFINRTLAAAGFTGYAAALLRPQLRTDFMRTTVFLPADAARVTIDTRLRLGAKDGRAHAFEDLVVVETKSGSRPSAVDHLLWASGRRPQKVSKYAIGCALFDTRLPANKWRRIIDTTFLPATHANDTGEPR